MTLMIPLWIIAIATIALGFVAGMMVVIRNKDWVDMTQPLFGLIIVLIPIFFWVIFFIGRGSK